MNGNNEQPEIVGKKLLLGGFIYVRSKQSTNGNFYWDCQKVRRGECKARAITRTSAAGLIIVKGPEESKHEHPPNQDMAKAEAAVVNMKRTAEEHPECPPAQV